MSEPPETPPDARDIDTGEPIAELAGLELPPAPGFLSRFRRRIGRRAMASQVAGFSWYAPALIVLQFLDMFFSLFERGQSGQGGSS